MSARVQSLNPITTSPRERCTRPHPIPQPLSPSLLSPSPPRPRIICPHPHRLTLVNVDSVHNVLISTIWDRKRSVLVNLQSNTTKFTVHARPASRLSHQRALFVFLPFSRGITVDIAPHPHGNPVRSDPVPTVLPWMWSHYRSFPAVTAVFPPSPLSCRLL